MLLSPFLKIKHYTTKFKTQNHIFNAKHVKNYFITNCNIKNVFNVLNNLYRLKFNIKMLLDDCPRLQLE